MAAQLFGPTIPGFAIPEHNYVSLAYTGTSLVSITYKQGGASGTTVATLSLTYDGNGNTSTITKS